MLLITQYEVSAGIQAHVVCYRARAPLYHLTVVKVECLQGTHRGVHKHGLSFCEVCFLASSEMLLRDCVLGRSVGEGLLPHFSEQCLNVGTVDFWLGNLLFWGLSYALQDISHLLWTLPSGCQ